MSSAVTLLSEKGDSAAMVAVMFQSCNIPASRVRRWYVPDADHPKRHCPSCSRVQL